jgi:DNA modification methylase
MKFVEFDDGLAVQGDSTSEEVISLVVDKVPNIRMIYTDPPYGGILNESWDRERLGTELATWMIGWTERWGRTLERGNAMYVWGGVGTYRNRPFMEYMSRVEFEADVKIQNVITWAKKRGIGTQYNYLFTREELAFMLRGGKNVKPLVFNVPLLSDLRGYAGFNKKYPAKSDYKRRTNVWSDVTEILSGKVHPAEKAAKVCEIPIEVSSNPGEWVVDLFAGSGSIPLAARKLGRKWVAIESDAETFEKMIQRLGA